MVRGMSNTPQVSGPWIFVDLLGECQALEGIQGWQCGTSKNLGVVSVLESGERHQGPTIEGEGGPTNGPNCQLAL